MREPDPKWGPAERLARQSIHCLRYELPADIVDDVAKNVNAAFEELRAASRPAEREDA